MSPVALHSVQVLFWDSRFKVGGSCLGIKCSMSLILWFSAAKGSIFHSEFFDSKNYKICCK
jgi:hypothetical protein